MRGEDVSVDALGIEGAERYDAFAAALDERRGTVAVVAAPYAGREAVLDRAADRANAERVDLDPGDDPPTVPDDGALVVGGCHHLFERRVGGFDRLDAFLERVAATDVLVVAGWNRYAWSYLSLAREAARPFDTELALPGVDAATLRDLVAARGTDARPVAAESSVPAVERRETTVTVRGRSVRVPYPWLNPEYLVARQADEDPETAVFDRLEQVANCNPGVALAVWERSVRPDGTVRPTDLDTPVESSAVDDRAAFCLRLVLSKERVPPEELDRTDGVDAAARRSLERQGLLANDEGAVVVPPAAVPDAVAVTERRRIP